MKTVYTTAPEDEAEEMARTLVEERVAACVNLHPVDSVYRWQGEIVEDGEVALEVKTALPYDEVERRIVEMHPYEVPAVVRYDVDDVLEEYEDWVEAATQEI